MSGPSLQNLVLIVLPCFPKGTLLIFAGAIQSFNSETVSHLSMFYCSLYKVHSSAMFSNRQRFEHLEKKGKHKCGGRTISVEDSRWTEVLSSMPPFSL